MFLMFVLICIFSVLLLFLFIVNVLVVCFVMVLVGRDCVVEFVLLILVLVGEFVF